MLPVSLLVVVLHENAQWMILISFTYSHLEAEEKQITETVKTLPPSDATDLALSSSSNENVQTNGIPDDGQSVSSTDNLVNYFTECLMYI